MYFLAYIGFTESSYRVSESEGQLTVPVNLNDSINCDFEITISSAFNDCKLCITSYFINYLYIRICVARHSNYTFIHCMSVVFNVFSNKVN